MMVALFLSSASLMEGLGLKPGCAAIVTLFGFRNRNIGDFYRLLIEEAAKWLLIYSIFDWAVTDWV